MSTPDNVDPADFGPDDDDAAIDEALQALTAGMTLTATADEDEELGDDVVGEGEDDVDEDDDDGEFTDDDVVGTLDVPLGADAPINDVEPGEELDEPADVTVTMPLPTVPDFEPAPAPAQERRLSRLEDLAAALIEAENAREGERVKRKVKASATGAAGAGLVPVVLMLTGAFNLDPELAATLSAGVAALASFVTGYFTPERKPALDPVVAHKVKKPRRHRK